MFRISFQTAYRSYAYPVLAPASCRRLTGRKHGSSNVAEVLFSLTVCASDLFLYCPVIRIITECRTGPVPNLYNTQLATACWSFLLHRLSVPAKWHIKCLKQSFPGPSLFSMTTFSHARGQPGDDCACAPSSRSLILILSFGRSGGSRYFNLCGETFLASLR